MGVLLSEQGVEGREKDRGNREVCTDGQTGRVARDSLSKELTTSARRLESRLEKLQL